MNAVPEFDPDVEYMCLPEINCRITELLYYTAVYPDLNKIELLATPDTINQQDDHGWTALMLAVLNKDTVDIKILELLLQKGADVNIRDMHGSTALMHATTLAYLPAVELLLKYGADVNTQDDYGYTPLMAFSHRNPTEYNLKIAKLLLDHGADVNLQNKSGDTALIQASKGRDEFDGVLVRILLENGADVNIRNMDGYSAILYSVKRGKTINIGVVRMLLENGADVNIQNIREETPLIMAVLQSDIETIKLLLEYGAEPYGSLKFCRTEECKQVISKEIWQRMQSNITNLSEQYARSTLLSKDAWRLILLHKKQKELCGHLLRSNKYLLMAFAEMLDIPVAENVTDRQLCKLISRQITWGRQIH